MIKLTQIKKQGNDITCIAMVEDCAEPIKITVNIASGTLQNSPLPAGYEWCTSHIAHAKRALERMVKADEIVPQTTVMWY